MPLDRDLLAQSLKGAFERIKQSKITQPPALVSPEGSEALADAIHGYAQSATASGMTPVLSRDLLVSSLSNSLAAAGLDAALSAYWSAAAWAGGGFDSGVTDPPSVLPGKLNSSLVDLFVKSTVDKLSTDDAAGGLADKIHGYCTSVTVTGTASGTPAPNLPVT